MAGVVQGFVFGFLVAFSKKYKSDSTYFLAAIILIFSLNNLQYYLVDTDIISADTFFEIVFVPYQLLVAPLLLFYGLKMIYPEKPLTFGNKLTLIPFAIGFLLTSSYKILSASNMRPEEFQWIFDPLQGLIEFSSIVLFQSVLMYLFLQILQLENGQGRAFTLSTRIEPLNWFKNILIIFFVITFMWICVAVMTYVYHYWKAYYIIWITLAVMIYYLGYVGISKFGIEQERKKIRSYSIANQVAPIVRKQKNEHIVALGKLLIEQKRYLDTSLTLDKIAEELNLSKSHLSRIINNELGVSLPDYLNALRVAEAKSHLRNPEFANYTLVAIGLEAGFNSKTTFNSAFKKITGFTPSEYRDSRPETETIHNHLVDSRV